MFVVFHTIFLEFLLAYVKAGDSQAFLKEMTGAEGRTRTGTGITTRRILSPLRLPIPPPRHTIYYFDYYFKICFGGGTRI